MEKQTKYTREELKKDLSVFEGAIVECVGCLVPDQTSELKDHEDRVYKGSCKDFDDLAITNITKQGKVWVKIVYNYKTYDEVLFLYK